jgi:hypothetical protein
MGSGVSRLSERNPNIARAIDDLPIGVTKKSKFFSRTRQPSTKVVELKWESSQEPIPIDVDDEPVVIEPLRSPSACASPTSLPPQADVEESFHHLTSPAAPEMSSPAVSSPPHGETFTSPRPERDTVSRSLSPISPTRAPIGKQTIPNVLIPSTSQIQLTTAPLSSSAPNRMQTANVGVLGTTTYSNFDSSSDTIESDEVVTPSVEVGRRNISATSIGKRSRAGDEDEVDEVELQERTVRAEKAKTISHDWKLKYAFGANVNSSSLLDRLPREIC